MGIDGIGKAPGLTPPGIAPGGASDAPGAVAGEAFRVQGAAPADVEATGALGRLARGELDLDGYLDLQVESATSHLTALPPQELAFVRQTLRAELGSDPVLVELVRRATGATPKLDE